MDYDGDTFSLPLMSTGIYDFIVDWGDGTTPDNITAYNDPAVTHTYAGPLPIAPYQFTISITGSCDKWSFWNIATSAGKVLRVLDMADLGFTRLSFGNCANLTTVSRTMNRLTHLIDVSYMFCGCSSLTGIPAGIFDGSTGLTNFSYLFANISAPFIPIFRTVPVDLFKYNTAVTTFEGIFSNNYSLMTIPADLFKYNTLVTTFLYAFNNCTGLTSIPVGLFNYNTAVTNFGNVFANCSNILLCHLYLGIIPRQLISARRFMVLV
jgi:hypothetical protein